MLDEQHNVDPQIDEDVDAEMEAKSSGLPLWVYIAGGAAVLVAVVLGICAFAGVFAGKSGTTLKNPNQGQAKRKVTGTENKTEITTEPTNVTDPKEPEVEVNSKATGFSTVQKAGGVAAVAATGYLSGFFGWAYDSVFGEADKPVIKPPQCTNPTFADEWGNPVCENPAAEQEAQEEAEEEAEGTNNNVVEGYTNTQVYGAYAVGGAVVLGGLYGIVRYFDLWNKYKEWKNGPADPNQGPQQPPVDDDNTSVNTDATDTTDGTTTDPIIDGNTTGGQTGPTDGPTVGGQPAPLVLEQGSYVLKNGNFYEVEQQNELTVPGANSTDDALYYAAGDHYLQKHFQHQGQNYEIVNIAQRQQKNAGGCSGCRGTHAVTDIIARDTAQAQNAPTVTIAWANAPTQMEVVTTPGL